MKSPELKQAQSLFKTNKNQHLNQIAVSKTIMSYIKNKECKLSFTFNPIGL